MKFCFLVSIAVFISLSVSSKELVDKVAASVNNEIVLLSDLKGMSARLKRAGSIDETLLLGASPESLKTDKKAQLDFLIREKLVDSEIKRANMGATDEQVASEFGQMAKNNRMSVPEFTSFISTQGFSADEYKTILRARFERRNFFEKEIISKLRITDEDAFGVFQSKNPNYKPSVGEYKIAQMFFSSKTGGGEKALERANAAYERLQAGEKFEALANQLDESGGGNKDGVLGTFKSGEFLPEIERAVSGLSANDTTGVLRGPSGFHIVKLLSKKSVLDPNFIKVKEAIKASLIQQNFERQLKNWFELKKLDAHIKIYEDTL